MFFREEIRMENGRVSQCFCHGSSFNPAQADFFADVSTGTKNFRELVSEIAMLMCYEATRDLPLMNVETVTPMEKTTTQVIAGRKLAFVPILRAGLGMVDGMLSMVPSAKGGPYRPVPGPRYLEAC